MLSLAAAGRGVCADWPQWRGPDENGIAREKLPKDFDAEEIVWRARVGIGFSSLAIAEGRLFTLGHDGGKETVWCLDAKTGKMIWSDEYEAALLPNLHEGGPAATPTVNGDRVITLGKDGKLHCYQVTDGSPLWKRDLLRDAGMPKPPEWGFAGSPLVMGKRVLVEAGMTLAIDRENGGILWRSQPFRPAYGSAARFKQEGAERIAVLKTDGLVVLDPENGGTLAFEKWETPFQTNATTPIVRGSSLFISTGYDRGCALFQFDGRHLLKRYENEKMSTHMNNAVLIDGHLYGFDGTAHRGRPTEFVCLELESGRERWRVPPKQGLGCGSLIATSDGQLIVLTEKGELVIAAASPDGFTIRSRDQVLGGRCWTPPALAGGRIYARNARGDVVCVGASD